MLTLNKVKKIEVKRTRIKGNKEKGIAPFHAIVLTVSHSPSNPANPMLEKIQIQLMSEHELPILEFPVEEETIQKAADEELTCGGSK